MSISAASLPAQISSGSVAPSASTVPDSEPLSHQAATPNFATANTTPASTLPMTPDQKYEFALHQALDPSAHLVNLFRTGLEQAANAQPHYGQGWGAYEKRFAAGELDQITGSTLIYGFLPSVLHQDPRYFPRARGSAIARAWYAASRTFVTQRDNGSAGFNTSETLGQLISCGISTSYYPARDRTLRSMSGNWAVDLSTNSIFNVFAEFYPDLKRAILRGHKQPSGN